MPYKLLYLLFFLTIVTAACSRGDSSNSGPQTYSGSCRFKFEIPGVKHPACLEFSNVAIPVETLSEQCLQGNANQNIGPGSWVLDSCSEENQTSDCADAPYAGGTISLKLYSAGFNHIIKNSCELGSGLFVNGPGTYTEYVALESL